MPTNAAVSSEPLGRLGEQRRLRAARHAPRAPDVEHDDLAPQVGQVERLAVEVVAGSSDRRPRGRRRRSGTMLPSPVTYCVAGPLKDAAAGAAAADEQRAGGRDRRGGGSRGPLLLGGAAGRERRVLSPTGIRSPAGSL